MHFRLTWFYWNKCITLVALIARNRSTHFDAVQISLAVVCADEGVALRAVVVAISTGVHAVRNADARPAASWEQHREGVSTLAPLQNVLVMMPGILPKQAQQTGHDVRLCGRVVLDARRNNALARRASQRRRIGSDIDRHLHLHHLRSYLKVTLVLCTRNESILLLFTLSVIFRHVAPSMGRYKLN